jgi:hypothetical protein
MTVHCLTVRREGRAQAKLGDPSLNNKTNTEAQVEGENGKDIVLRFSIPQVDGSWARTNASGVHISFRGSSSRYNGIKNGQSCSGHSFFTWPLWSIPELEPKQQHMPQGDGQPGEAA